LRIRRREQERKRKAIFETTESRGKKQRGRL